MTMSEQDIADYDREKAVGDWVESIIKSSMGQERIISEITSKILEAQSDTKYANYQYDGMLDSMKLVAHAIETFGLCNPDVQLARLDPEVKKDWVRVQHAIRPKKNKHGFSIQSWGDMRIGMLAESVLRGDVASLSTEERKPKA